MKKVIFIFLNLVFALSVFTACSNEEQTLSFYNESHTFLMDSDSKNAFAAEMDSKFDAEAQKKLSEEELAQLLEQLVFAGEDKQDAIQELADHDYYLYNPKQGSVPLMESEDAVLMGPCILYSPADQTWIVCFGGNWVNDNWKTMTSGDKDEYGIRYEFAQNPACSCEDAYFKITDQNNENAIVTRHRGGTLEYADGFRLNDEVKGFFNKSYIGYRWFGYLIYDSEFANLDGRVVGYYIHNYEE